MSYKPRKQGCYGNRPNRRTYHGTRKTWTKDTNTTKLFGKPIITRENEHEEEETPIPEFVKEQRKVSGGVGIGNSVGKIEFSVGKEKTKETKYPKSADYV
jgi:hypothetical protein